MRVGLFFGSFNPVHHGHLIIASYILQHSGVDQVWFVVSPQNPLKSAVGLLNEYQRLYLVKLAIEGEKKFRASDIEFYLPRPSYTIDTLTYLHEKYPGYEFEVIIGSDSFRNFGKWKNYQQILKNFPIIVYRRPGQNDLPEYETGRVSVLDAPLIEISATQIRENIRKGLSIRYLVPDGVREEIEKTGYYRQ